MSVSRTREEPSQPIIGIVGDRNPAYLVHRATEKALRQLPAALGFEWLPTEEIGSDPQAQLARYAGLLIAPGSPYHSMAGALAAIRYARERGVPLLGTCGGFQHVVVEFARDVVGIADADHEETNPTGPRLAVTALSCSLAGQDHPVNLVAGTRAREVYEVARIIEPFFCNFGLNPEFRAPLEQRGLVVSGVDDNGEVRVLELPIHPFFIATLYVPQARSTSDQPHPLLLAFVEAATRYEFALADK